MKALKIFAFAIISSMFLLACEKGDDPVPFEQSKDATEKPAWHSSQSAYN